MCSIPAWGAQNCGNFPHIAQQSAVALKYSHGTQLQPFGPWVLTVRFDKTGNEWILGTEVLDLGFEVDCASAAAGTECG